MSPSEVQMFDQATRQFRKLTVVNAAVYITRLKVLEVAKKVS